MLTEGTLLPLFPCRLWTPIDGEFDDYIVNPKHSGYQVNVLFFFNTILTSDCMNT